MCWYLVTLVLRRCWSSFCVKMSCPVTPHWENSSLRKRGSPGIIKPGEPMLHREKLVLELGEPAWIFSFSIHELVTERPNNLPWALQVSLFTVFPHHGLNPLLDFEIKNIRERRPKPTDGRLCRTGQTLSYQTGVNIQESKTAFCLQRFFVFCFFLDVDFKVVDRYF